MPGHWEAWAPWAPLVYASGLWRDSLHVTCGLTACTPGSAPGPTLGSVTSMGKLYLYLFNNYELRPRPRRSFGVFIGRICRAAVSAYKYQLSQMDRHTLRVGRNLISCFITLRQNS